LSSKIVRRSIPSGAAKSPESSRSRAEPPGNGASRRATKRLTSGRIQGMIPVRGRRGYEVYAKGMEASAADKAKLLKSVRPGVIAALGCGTGTVLELLQRTFRKSQFVGVDLSPE